jgi:hypothetical protein
MKDKIDEIQKLLEELGWKLSEVKSKFDWLINQETLIIPKEEFKNFKLSNKKDNYLLYEFLGVGFVLGTSGTENIKEKLLSGKLEYLVLRKLSKPKSWYSFIQTHEVLKEEEAALKVLYR